MLLAILYLLSATDIHYENLIASGEHPLIVDLETLLSGQIRKVSSNRKDDVVADPMLAEPSVLSIGLLPRWQTAPEGQEFDLSGLGADETQHPGKGHWSWQSVNTDQMMLSEQTSLKPTSAHRVRFGNTLPSALDKLPMLLAGFKEVYACFLSNKKRLLDDVALLNAFDNLELRILVRSTMTYARLQLRLLHPEFLKDGVDRSIELDWLARPLCRPVSPEEHHRQMYECERTAMENFDIPHFRTSAWRHLEDLPEEAELASLFRKRDSSMIKRRLAILGPDDCSRQLAIIENTLRSRFS
jgi:lantibiotic modifying enzyme